MTDEPIAKVFDMPHARVTLTPVGPNVEIEVWPKQGQSAYAVVDPAVAILIARHLVTIAAAQIAAAQTEAAEAEAEAAGAEGSDDDAGEPISIGVAGGSTDAGDGAGSATAEVPEGAADDDDDLPPPPSNIVDLASRRRSSKQTPA